MSQHQPLDIILDTTNCISFTDSDTKGIIDYIKTSNSKGYNIALHPHLSGDIKEALQEGFFMLQSYMLDTDFIFINANGGFIPGASSKSLLVALTSINNIYRQYA